MPTREAIVDSVIPRQVEKPIPTRTIITRPGPQRTKVAGQELNENQVIPVRGNPGEEAPAPEESVRLSPQLSALARKEQAYRQRELALKQREKDLETKLAKAEQFEQLTSKLGNKDFSEAEKLGLNYEEYTNYLLTKQEGEDPQTQALKKLESEIAALKGQREEDVEQQFEETKAEYGKEITRVVAENPEFSSIKELKAEGHVLQLILDSWEEDKLEMTVEEACKEIENAIVEQGKKFSSLPKLKPAPEVMEDRLPPPRPGVRTLTNQMQANASEARPAKSLQHLSESERYAEARRRVLARRQPQG